VRETPPPASSPDIFPPPPPTLWLEEFKLLFLRRLSFLLMLRGFLGIAL